MPAKVAAGRRRLFAGSHLERALPYVSNLALLLELHVRNPSVARADYSVMGPGPRPTSRKLGLSVLEILEPPLKKEIALEPCSFFSSSENKPLKGRKTGFDGLGR